MTSYLALVKLFLKSLKLPSPKLKRQRMIMRIFIIFVVLFILIPFLFSCSAFVFSTTKKLIEYDYQNVGLEMMCMLIMIFAFIFGFSVILNEFYFTDDIDNLLPLPLKPFEIIASKFTATFISESALLILVVLFSVFGFGMALDIPVINYVLGIIGMLTLPIVPLVYCGLICLIIMSFTKYIKNKEMVRNIGTFILLFVLVAAIFLITKLNNFNLDKYIEAFVNGDQGFLDNMRIIFPHINLFVDTISSGNVFSLLFYILINIAYIVVFLFVAQKLYFRGVINLSSNNTKSLKKKHDLIKNIKVHRPVRTYFLKEIRTLFRTPSYFLNCIAINLIWPLFVYLIYVFVSNKSISELQELVSSGNEKTLMFIFIYLVFISILVPTINGIASSSFSREGKHFDFMKYIPLDYRSQILAKFLASFVISFIGINVFTIVFFIVIKISLKYFLLYFLLSILCVVFVSTLGVVIDSIYPRLTWDDEIDILRENTNNFLVMGLTTFFTFLLCGVGYHFFRKGVSFDSILLTSIISLVVLNIITTLLLLFKAPKNIESMEDL